LLHRRDAEENKIKPEGAEVAEAAETFGLVVSVLASV
jgi:hypothetical protein